MEAKEIQQRGQAIISAAQKDKEPSLILKILDELRKGVVATEDLLRSTRIGVSVNKLRTHKDPSVQSQATQLVNKWRNDVKKSSGGKKANGTASPAPAAASTPTPQASKEAPLKVKAKHTVAPEKRNVDTDKVDWKATGNATRDNCLKLIYNGLAFMSEELPDEVFHVARAVEVAAYNKFRPETSEPYRTKMRSLFQNLKNKSNPQLRVRVVSGDIAPERFVVMTHDELKSDERRKEDEKLEKENMREAMVAQEEKTISTSLQCGKCRQKRVSYNQAQTRSADEPMTTFCECLNCGNRWKFS